VLDMTTTQTTIVIICIEESDEGTCRQPHQSRQNILSEPFILNLSN